MRKVQRIVSGGQTGVDRAALRAARSLGISASGWCPPGRTADDGIVPPQYILEETPEDRSPYAPDVPRSLRTEWNVRDSSATLILCRASDLDAGTRFALECARRHRRPVQVLDPSERGTIEEAKQWLASIDASVLNVAGPAERRAPGIGAQAYRFLIAILSA